MESTKKKKKKKKKPLPKIDNIWKGESKEGHSCICDWEKKMVKLLGTFRDNIVTKGGKSRHVALNNIQNTVSRRPGKEDMIVKVFGVNYSKISWKGGRLLNHGKAT